MENGEDCEKGHYYSAESGAVHKLIKWCGFFCRVVVIQGKTMLNNVQMVLMLKD